MTNQTRKWVYLVGLAIVWGSSFILMKKALIGLTAFQMGALRMAITSLFLFAYNFKSIFSIPKDKWKWIVITALLSTFFPSFFFAIAQTKIDSSVSAVLNSLMPVFSLIIGVFFFKSKVLSRQIFGVILGFIGTATLILSGAGLSGDSNSLYGLLIVLSSIGYASNINIVKNHLADVDSVAITVGNFSVLFIPAMVILYFNDFFTMETLSKPIVQESVGYIAILALFGTAIAKITFNKLIKISTPVFSASVTYLIPIVAIVWGLFDGERFNSIQVLGGFLILIGVFLSNLKKA